MTSMLPEAVFACSDCMTQLEIGARSGEWECPECLAVWDDLEWIGQREARQVPVIGWAAPIIGWAAP